MNAAQLINQTSGEVEYYTDPKIIEAARSMMGEITLDPASSAKANEVVRAKIFFGPFDDSLRQDWLGSIWLNHPFGRRNMDLPIPMHGNAAWIDKLMEEWEGGNINEALCITYACTSEKWFQPLLDFPQCFLCPRTNYFLPDGTIKKGVTKGSVITYLGDRETRFHRYFKSFGKCHKPL